MGLFAAFSSGTASANDDKEISKDYTITITHAHTGNTSMIVNEQPVLMSAQYSESRQLVTITFDKAVTAQDLTSLAVTKNGQVIANTSYVIDSADAKGVQIPQKINVKRSGNWTYEANVAPGSYMLTVVAEKNDQTATKNVAVHIVK